MRSDLGQVATRAPASVSLPTEGQSREARLFLQYFAHTPHSREFPSPPAEPGRAGSPTLRWGTAGGGSDVGPPLPVPPPAPAPNVGAPRAPRPRWPRYCFTFPGVYFSLIGKKRDGGRSERGLRFPLPGHARRAPDRPGEGLRPDPRAEPAPRSPPPSPPPAPGSRLPAPPPLASRPRSHRILTSPPAVSLRASVRRPTVGAHASGDAPPSPSPPAAAPAAALRPLPSPRPSSPARCARWSRARGEGGGLGERPRPCPAPFPAPGDARPGPGPWSWGHAGARFSLPGAPAKGKSHPRAWAQRACGPGSPES